MPGVQEDEHIELEHILSDSRKACKKAFAQTRKFILPCKKRLFPAGRRFSFAKRGAESNAAGDEDKEGRGIAKWKKDRLGAKKEKRGNGGGNNGLPVYNMNG